MRHAQDDRTEIFDFSIVHADDCFGVAVGSMPADKQ